MKMSGLDTKKAPLMAHFKEFRTRILWSLVVFFILFFILYAFSQDIFDFLLNPLVRAWGGQGQRQVVFTALYEQFFVQVKVAFFAAFCLSFPFFSIQLWRFIAPGLYADEKRLFLIFLVATPFLFILGAAFVYFVGMPVAYKFFLSFEQKGSVHNLAVVALPKVSEYLSLTIRLILAFGICFELPVLLTLLAHIGIVTPQGLRKKRKYAVLIVFIVAAFLTPPDPLSQLGLALPLLLLYEISIWTSGLVIKSKENRTPRQE